jgi:hypothetical protein
LVCAAAFAAHGQGSDTPAAPPAETFLAEGDGMTLHLRIASGRQVELFAPATGGRLSGAGLINNRGGIGGFTGMLANGTAFGITGSGDGRSLWIGDRTFSLRPMAAAQFGVGAPPAPAAHAAAGSRGAVANSLAGLRLHTAKFSNGYGSERSYDLCADGSVFTRWSELQSSQFGSGASERADQGRWQHDGNTLLLSLQRGGAVRLLGSVDIWVDNVPPTRWLGWRRDAKATSR